MSTDPVSSIAAEQSLSSAPVNENEFSSYRAISRGAVFSVLFGLMSLACFASPWSFAAFPILAIVTGVLATRRIRRFPDILTGEKLAQAGITMGLCFGLMSVTLYSVQRYLYARSAAEFAKGYVTILQKGTLGDMLLYSIDPKSRQTTTAEKMLEQSRARASDPASSGMAEMKHGPYQRIMSRIASGGDQHVEFVRIDKVTMSEDKPLAWAIFKIHGPPSKEFPEEEELIGTILKSLNDGSDDPWFVNDIVFPYKPESELAPTEPAHADDGHGHAH